MEEDSEAASSSLNSSLAKCCAFSAMGRRVTAMEERVGRNETKLGKLQSCTEGINSQLLTLNSEVRSGQDRIEKALDKLAENAGQGGGFLSKIFGKGANRASMVHADRASSAAGGGGGRTANAEAESSVLEDLT
mgnify:CR=1 FL=1